MSLRVFLPWLIVLFLVMSVPLVVDFDAKKEGVSYPLPFY